MITLYKFGKDPSFGLTDMIEFIEFKVSKLMTIDTFSKRNI